MDLTPEQRAETAWSRLCAHWVYGGFLAGVMLIVLAPLLVSDWPLAQALVFLSLPVYMVHQYEEHDADRFRRYVNKALAGGVEALTVPGVFWVNILGVWALLTGVLWLVRVVDPGWGAIAGWLLVINAMAHIGQTVRLRQSNPGLWTALALFVPLGFGLLVVPGQSATLVQHAVAVAVVLAVHVAIFAQVAVARRKANP